MTTHFIISDDDVTSLGGDPIDNPAIPGRDRLAIRPEALTGGGYALPLVARDSATLAQEIVLDGLPQRDVAIEEFRWWQDAQGEG